MSILYFLAGHPSGLVSAAQMKELGLGYALTAGDPTARAVGRGPEDAAGVLAVPSPIAGEAAVKDAFSKDEQTWRKGPTRQLAGQAVTIWVGYWNDRKPGPQQLRRAKVYPGNSVRLCDGNDWVIPRCVAVLGDEGRPHTLPTMFDVADDGETPISRVHPAYDALNDAAFRFWKDFAGFSKPGERMSGKEQVDLAISALQVNYRVGLIEALGLLQLWGSDEFGLILRAMIDADEVSGFFERRKKAAPT